MKPQTSFTSGWGLEKPVYFCKMTTTIRSLALATIFGLPLFLFAQSKEANLLGHWFDPALSGSAAYDNTYNEVWGIAVNGHEYGIIGSTAGTHFIDITDPTMPWEAFFVPGAATGASIIHRDYHDYAGYLYAVCDEGQSTLQIMDITHLPDSLPVVYDSKARFSRSHNIFIDTASALLYTLATSGGDSPYSGMRVYDLANPISPTLVGSYNTFGSFSFGHVHDAYVRNDTAFLNCGYDGFTMVDFSDPYQPVPLGTLTSYPGKGYNHSGWQSEDGSYYFMADETHGSPLKVLDIKDPENIKVASIFEAIPGDLKSIPHNLLIRGDYLYVSYYYDGLRVFDIHDPENPPIQVLHYSTSSEPKLNSYKGAWGAFPYLPSGNILISDMQEGLFVFAPVEPSISAIPKIQNNIAFTISPNPASHQIQLSHLPIGGPFEARLLDLCGRIVNTWRLADDQPHQILDLPADLSTGLFILELKGAHGAVGQTIQITPGE